MNVGSYNADFTPKWDVLWYWVKSGLQSAAAKADIAARVIEQWEL